jgi:hypothetical protein
MLENYNNKQFEVSDTFKDDFRVNENFGVETQSNFVNQTNNHLEYKENTNIIEENKVVNTTHNAQEYSVTEDDDDVIVKGANHMSGNIQHQRATNITNFKIQNQNQEYLNNMTENQLYRSNNQGYNNHSHLSGKTSTVQIDIDDEESKQKLVLEALQKSDVDELEKQAIEESFEKNKLEVLKQKERFFQNDYNNNNINVFNNSQNQYDNFNSQDNEFTSMNNVQRTNYYEHTDMKTNQTNTYDGNNFTHQTVNRETFTSNPRDNYYDTDDDQHNKFLEGTQVPVHNVQSHTQQFKFQQNNFTSRMNTNSDDETDDLLRRAKRD